MTSAISLPNPPVPGTPVERMMVHGRPSDTGSVYKVANIMPALDALGGVRKMRARDPYSGTPGWKTYVGLAREGVKFSFVLTVREIARTVADLKAFLQEAPGSIWAIEFPNEPDLNPITYKGMKDQRLGFRKGNAPALMAYIKDIRTALKADRNLAKIPLIASNSFMQAEQGPYCDYGNTHYYPHPDADVGDKLTKFGAQVAEGGHKYGVITEWGRTTGGNSKNNTSPPVTQAQQAELLAPTSRPPCRALTSTPSAYSSCSAGVAPARSIISDCSIMTCRRAPQWPQSGRS